MVLLGSVTDAVAVVRLSDKGLAHTFYRWSNPGPLADFLLVVSNALAIFLTGSVDQFH